VTLDALKDLGVLLADHVKEGWSALLENHGMFAEADKDGGDASIDGASDREREVDADEERKEDDGGSVLAIRVVRRLGVCVSEKSSPIRTSQIDIGKEATQEAVEVRAPHNDHADERVVDKSIDAAVLHQAPRVLGGGNVRLAVEGNLDVRVWRQL
jgi:hypothetical protein